MPKIIVIADTTRLSDTDVSKRACVMADGIESNAAILPQISANVTVLRSRIDSMSDYQARAALLRAEASELEQKTNWLS